MGSVFVEENTFSNQIYNERVRGELRASVLDEGR